MTISVLLVDDQAMVRAGFRMILEAAGDVDITGEASDGGKQSRPPADFVPMWC